LSAAPGIAVLKLMFGALIRAAERWRSIKVTEFERRQMAAIRQELDQEYETWVGLQTRPSKATPAASRSDKGCARQNIQQPSALTRALYRTNPGLLEGAVGWPTHQSM
jgi:hypothetical protein